MDQHSKIQKTVALPDGVLQLLDDGVHPLAFPDAATLLRNDCKGLLDSLASSRRTIMLMVAVASAIGQM